ncbi:CAP domain-containing protein [Lachnoclostridium pacaense]|uniref:CAP domain-containing protein n=1 Tax=Enterocloster hominis (ex Hitch et al. 2024) TaxID=1917870 RepID=UPI001D129041|nr:CAP domain-containing protein [Lachnoclostridium pacaense]MCC2821011.1 CAP domain-containing protein [Lachnoclostridium pacaense]
MFKKLVLMTMVAIMLAATPAYAGQWIQDGNGWRWQNDDGSYPFLTWAWIDGNHDGIAENYFFNNDGYLSMNPVDQGVPINADGAALYNGVVCTTVLPDGKDYYPGMAINGQKTNWVYDATQINELERQEAEERAAASGQDSVLEDIDPYELAYRIVELANEKRESKGKRTLEINDELMENAMVRAEEADESFSHTRPDGDYYNTVITVEHVSSAENLAGGGIFNNDTLEDLAEEIVNGWWKSSGHKKNMLDSRWEETGVGVSINGNVYNVSQLFIKR